MIGNIEFFNEPGGVSIFSANANGLTLTTAKANPPAPRITLANVPGRHGSIDYSSFFGETILDSTTVQFRLSIQDGASITALSRLLMQKLHGKTLFFRVSSMTAGRYYKGRVYISAWQRKNNVASFLVSADVDPFLYGVMQTGVITVASRTAAAFNIATPGDYYSNCAFTTNASIRVLDVYGNLYESISTSGGVIVGREFSSIIAGTGAGNNNYIATNADGVTATVNYSFFPLYFFEVC